MDDLIRRQAAIDALTENKEMINVALDSLTLDYNTRRNLEQRRGQINEDVETIKELPSAQPEPRWIPCNEETGDGYPEEDGFYYVTEQNYGFYLDAVCKQRVTHTSHFRNGDFTDRFYAENNSNITAWMPLPESYRGSEDE